MTATERGLYREMLDEQWDNGGVGLPDDPRACADLLGVGTEAEWLAAWPALRRKFVDRRAKARSGDPPAWNSTDHDPNRRIINLKLSRQWVELDRYRREREIAGRKGGLRKALHRKDLPSSTATAKLQHSSSSNVVEPSSSSSSSTSSSSSSSSSTPTPTRGLAYDGRVLSIHHWQYTEMGKRLSEQKREGFDLLGWFEKVEADIDRTGEVLPAEQTERWTWLLGRLYRDAELQKPNLMGRGKTAGNFDSLSRFATKGATA
jgi:hypothetical protein